MAPSTLKTLAAPFSSSQSSQKDDQQRGPSRVSTAPAERLERTFTSSLNPTVSVRSNTAANAPAKSAPTASAQPSQQQPPPPPQQSSERTLPRIRLNTSLLHTPLLHSRDQSRDHSREPSHSRTQSAERLTTGQPDTKTTPPKSDKHSQPRASLDKEADRHQHHHHHHHGIHHKHTGSRHQSRRLHTHFRGESRDVKAPQSAIHVTPPGGGLLGDKEREHAMLGRTASTRNKVSDARNSATHQTTSDTSINPTPQPLDFILVGGRRRHRNSITEADLQALTQENHHAETELREILSNLTTLATSTTRRLDYTYYRFLEKTGALQSSLASFQDLTLLSSTLTTDFTQSTTSLETEISTSLKTFSSQRKTQEEQIAHLETRMRTATEKAASLNTRLDAVRDKILTWDRDETEWQAKISRRLRILWGVIGTLVLVFVALLIFHHLPESPGTRAGRDLEKVRMQKERMEGVAREEGMPLFKVLPFGEREVRLEAVAVMEAEGEEGEGLEGVKSGRVRVPGSKEEIVEMVMGDIMEDGNEDGIGGERRKAEEAKATEDYGIEEKSQERILRALDEL